MWGCFRAADKEQVVSYKKKNVKIFQILVVIKKVFYCTLRNPLKSAN